MKPNEQPRRSGLASVRLVVACAICIAIPVLLLGASGPAWWYNPTLTFSGTPIISGTANDYAAVNQGQVKNFAVTAINELNAGLSDVGGAGSALNGLAVSLTATSGSTSDFASINLGQLKALAKPFYDRLFSIDYFGPPLTSGTYPWIGNTPNDFAMANIGQVKNLFSFDLTYSSDGNPLPNWWRMYYFQTLSVSSTSTVTGNGSDITYLQAYQQQVNPSPVRHSPSEVLVVYNSNSPISTAIAADYIAKRGITNVVSVACVDSATNSVNETIPLATYTSEIANPISAYLSGASGINFIVLTKGIPIRITGANTGESSAPSPDRPSLDSYLAAIDYPTIPGAVQITVQGSGITGNVWLNRYWNATVPFSHAVFGGYLVTRLDGYTQSDAMGLSSEALSAEAALAPYGRILLDADPVFGMGDKTQVPYSVTGNLTTDYPYSSFNADLAHAADLLEVSALPVDADLTAAFIGGRSSLLGYYSWGSNDPNFTAAAYESLSFAPGSFCDTCVSTSARTFLPTTGGQSLIADLISHGVTCVEGCVDEPMFPGISSPSVALSRYLSGFTMAESFYAASHFVGWEEVMVGDPLCCPYPQRQIAAPIQASNFQNSSNIQTETCSEGGMDIALTSSGSYSVYDNVNLTGMTSFEARLACPAGGSTISIYLDSLNGPPIGVCTAPSTGATQSYKDACCGVTGATGLHNVYLVYSAGLELQWLAFKEANPALGTLPSPWVGADLGSVGLAGSHLYSSVNNTFANSGSGAGMGATADAGHYLYQSGTGKSLILARIASESATNPSAQAGVMIRGSTDPANPNAAVLASPGGGVTFQWRSSEGAGTASTSVSGVAPVWARLVQLNAPGGALFVAYSSPDGVNWTPIGAPQAVSMPAVQLTGMAVGSSVNTQVETATFDNVFVSSGALPSPWAGTDIGASGVGDQSYDAASGDWIGLGSGTQIGGAADSYHFIYEPATVTGTLTARVVESGTGEAGVMVSGTLGAGSVNASVLLTTSTTVTFEYRSSAGGAATSTSVAANAGPVYVSLATTGSSITGSYSYDGVNWTTIGAPASMTMPAGFDAGLAVSGNLVATFDHFAASVVPSQ
jgi:uncharacterized protein (TIGR03790 family)